MPLPHKPSGFALVSRGENLRVLDQEGEGIAHQAIFVFEKRLLDIGNASLGWQFFLDPLQKGIESRMCGLLPLFSLLVVHRLVYDLRIPKSIPLTGDAPDAPGCVSRQVAVGLAMNKGKEVLKAELLEYYSQALDEMLKACPERGDFTELEDQVEMLARKMLPKTLEALVNERGLFPPKLPKLPK